MSEPFGSQSMVAPLKRVLVRRPDEAFGNADPLRWNYTARPDLAAAREEHDALVAILEDCGAEVLYHQQPLPDHADAIYVHDPVIVSDQGAVILSPGKELRRGEEEAMAAALADHGVPILATLHGQARAEGGDLLWIDHHTLAAGLGFRTNSEGVGQLRQALGFHGVEVMGFDLCVYAGAQACLHLMSSISLVDHDLAVVYPPLMPVRLWQLLAERDIATVEVPNSELETMGPNVLALAPRQCLMLDGNPITRRRLEAAGCEVHTYRGHEVSLKAEGGPTCLTRPILRG